MAMMLLSSEMLMFGLVNLKMSFLTWKMNHIQEDSDHLMPQWLKKQRNQIQVQLCVVYQLNLDNLNQVYTEGW